MKTEEGRDSENKEWYENISRRKQRMSWSKVEGSTSKIRVEMQAELSIKFVGSTYGTTKHHTLKHSTFKDRRF